MKKLIQLTVIIGMMMLFPYVVGAQVTTPNNFGGVLDYVGWNAAQVFPLNIQHFGPQPIRFRTNFGAAPLGAGNRMIITDGGFGNNGGQIAIGNNLPNAFIPADRFHVHQTGGPTYMRISANFTGNSATDGTSFGLRGVPPAALVAAFEVHQWETAPIDFYTNDPNTAIHDRKLRIWHDPITDEPRVGIGPVIRPLTFQHIGGPLAIAGTGYRAWMNVGTLYSAVGLGAPDNMYVGLRQYAMDSLDAIINWGNNPSNTNAVGDRLRFVFTASAGSGVASTVDGLELGRMVVRTIGPGVVEGFTGFGDFWNNAPDPQNTVEINSLAPNPLSPGGNSGLRFRDLTSVTPTITNPGAGVLAVDSVGNVIYVPAGASNCFFAQPLTANAGTDLGGLGGFNYHFIGNLSGSTLDNSVLIGKNCLALPLAKLDVFQRSLSVGTGSTGIHVENLDLSGGTFTTSSIGIKSTLSANPSDFWRVAGWFECPHAAGLSSTAIFVPEDGGGVSIGFQNYFPPNTSGLLEVNGNIYTTGAYQPSDVSYKINISAIQNAMNKIKRLNGVYFNWDTLNNPTMNFESEMQIGLIAQNVDSVVPEVIRTDVNNKKSLVYDRLIALMVEGMKEQDLRIDSLFQYSFFRANNNP